MLPNIYFLLQSEFSTGVKFGAYAFLPVPKQQEEDLYEYVPPVYASEGPAVPSAADIRSNGYVRHVRAELPIERTGGYRSIIACQRALQEAMQGLFHGC